MSRSRLGDVDEPAAKPDNVWVADLSADRDTPLGAAWRTRRIVPGSPACSTGDVGTGDEVEHGVVIAESPTPNDSPGRC
jgi:hypothetical protein